MSGSRRRSSSSGSRFEVLPQDVEDDYDDDSDSAEEMKLSQDFYPTDYPGVETVPKSASGSGSGSSPGEMQLSQEFYPQGDVPTQPSTSQRQRVSSRIFEIQPVKTEEPTGLDFQWDHFGRVPNLYDDVAVDALQDLYGQGQDTEPHTPLDITEDLLILRDIGLNIDYPGGLLGEGMFGAVYRGNYGQNVMGGLVPEHRFAAKIVDFGNPTDPDISMKRESFETEKYILTDVSHRNVVTIRMIINMGEVKSFPFSNQPSKRYLSPERIYLIMDFADGGELHGYMQDNRTKMEPSLRINFIRDLFFGLWYLHQREIIHGDVHSGNALIFKDGDDLVAKWSDFGMGYVGRNRQYQYATARQMPQRHSFKSDMNGLHTVIHEILRARRQCRRETPEEKKRLNQCEEMADLMIRNVQSLQEVYQQYRHILEDELVFQEQHYS